MNVHHSTDQHWLDVQAMLYHQGVTDTLVNRVHALAQMAPPEGKLAREAVLTVVTAIRAAFFQHKNPVGPN